MENDSKPTTFQSLSEAVNHLIDQGYSINFKSSDDGFLVDTKNESIHKPENLKIDEVYRFEGMSSSGDNSVVYALSNKESNEKGLLVDAYGAYANKMNTEIIDKIKKAK